MYMHELFSNPNFLLTLMVASYLIPISYVYYKHTTTCKSVSSIITSNEPLFITQINGKDNDFQQVLSNNDAFAGGGNIGELITTRVVIAVCMAFMGLFTILYEIQRGYMWSIILISILLVGIFGVIFVPETNPTHYIFAGAAFLSIFAFMVFHSFYSSNLSQKCINLRLLVYLQLLFMVVTIIGVIQDSPIFIFESLFILNFAVYYLYLHYKCLYM
jgi:hypothetical protein